MKTAFWLAGATALALAAPAMAGDSIKIGFVSTFSGPTAVIGNDMRNSFELALDHDLIAHEHDDLTVVRRLGSHFDMG